MQRDSSESRRLIDRCRGGDEGAFGMLFDRHRSYLKKVVALRVPDKLRSRIDPSDVVQEAHLEACRRAEEVFDESAVPFRLWLRRITYERLLTAWRRHGAATKRSVEREVRLPEGSSVLLADRLMAEGPSPLERFAQHELAERVQRAVAKLSEFDREIILLHNFEGLTSVQSALVLEIEPAAARKRYGRALLRLRTLLNEEGVTGSET